MNAFSIAFIAQLILIAMKVTKVLAWSWAAVFIPTYVALALLVVIIIAGAIAISSSN